MIMEGIAVCVIFCLGLEKMNRWKTLRRRLMVQDMGYGLRYKKEVTTTGFEPATVRSGVWSATVAPRDRPSRRCRAAIGTIGLKESRNRVVFRQICSGRVVSVFYDFFSTKTKYHPGIGIGELLSLPFSLKPCYFWCNDMMIFFTLYETFICNISAMIRLAQIMAASSVTPYRPDLDVVRALHVCINVFCTWNGNSIGRWCLVMKRRREKSIYAHGVSNRTCISSYTGRTHCKRFPLLSITIFNDQKS